MKLLLTKNIKYDFDSVDIIHDENDINLMDDYVAISEIIDVDFPMIDFDLTARKIEVIDKDIAKAKAGIELLEQAKAELLAIPDMTE